MGRLKCPARPSISLTHGHMTRRLTPRPRYCGLVYREMLRMLISLKCRADLLPIFHTNLSMISSKERGKKHVEEQSHGGADDRGAETVGSGSQGGGRGAGSGGVEAHDLCLEGEVRRDGCERGTGSEAVAG